MKLTNEEFVKILNIGIALTTETNSMRLLSHILDEAMEITHCDAATLYLYDENVLKFYIMKTLSQNISRGENGDEITDIPPVEFDKRNVCAYCGLERKIINIPDVYNSEEFDFSGPKKYDKLTGYHTQSMLVVPLETDEKELIGVLQLLNAQDENGTVIPFHEQYETIIRSLGSLTAIKMTNLRYLNEMKMLLHSFVEAFATAIDERTPYNGSHTRKVAEYAVVLAEKINEKYKEGLIEEGFDDDRIEKLKLAALLHDIGKMIVPISVMNKATRLEGMIENIENRFQLIKVYYEVDYLKHHITKEVYDSKINEMDEVLEFVHSIDAMGFLNDEAFEKVQEISKLVYINNDGKRIPYFNENETIAMSIRKGTLSSEDRKIMESHAVLTSRILSKVHFAKAYENVPRWAGEHHEFLDGTGYPKGLKENELDIETKILTVADIYDALTATDRPYKKPIPHEKVIEILFSMADEGKIEKQLVEWLNEALREDNK